MRKVPSGSVRVLGVSSSPKICSTEPGPRRSSCPESSSGISTSRAQTQASATPRPEASDDAAGHGSASGQHDPPEVRGASRQELGLGEARDVALRAPFDPSEVPVALDRNQEARAAVDSRHHVLDLHLGAGVDQLVEPELDAGHGEPVLVDELGRDGGRRGRCSEPARRRLRLFLGRRRGSHGRALLVQDRLRRRLGRERRGQLGLWSDADSGNAAAAPAGERSSWVMPTAATAATPAATANFRVFMATIPSRAFPTAALAAPPGAATGGGGGFGWAQANNPRDQADRFPPWRASMRWRSSARPRLRRERTVPAGTPWMRAISADERSRK